MTIDRFIEICAEVLSSMKDPETAKQQCSEVTEAVRYVADLYGFPIKIASDLELGHDLLVISGKEVLDFTAAQYYPDLDFPVRMPIAKASKYYPELKKDADRSWNWKQNGPDNPWAKKLIAALDAEENDMKRESVMAQKLLGVVGGSIQEAAEPEAVIFDHKERPSEVMDQLIPVLNKLGVHVHELPSMDGSDSYGYVISKKAMSAEEIKQFEIDSGMRGEGEE